MIGLMFLNFMEDHDKKFQEKSLTEKKILKISCKGWKIWINFIYTKDDESNFFKVFNYIKILLSKIQEEFQVFGMEEKFNCLKNF